MEQEQVKKTEQTEAPAEVVVEDRPLTYAERQEIKELSKRFFGSSSKWQKLERKGTLVPMRDAEGKPIVVGLNHKVRDAKGKPSPMYLTQTTFISPFSLLGQLRAAKAQQDAAREAQRLEQEARKAASQASGTAV